VARVIIPAPPAVPSPKPARLSVSGIRTDLAKKADPAMYEDNDDPMDAAEQLARLDPGGAAEAYRAIACDQSIDHGLRLEAAEQLPDLDRRAAAEAFGVIACDASVDEGLRCSAAEQLPDLDPKAAAEAFRVIACDVGVDDGLRSSAAGQLAPLHPQAAAEAFHALSDDDEDRIEAARQLARFDRQVAARAGRKTARRQLDSRTTVPLGTVNTRSSGCLPVTALASSAATNRESGRCGIDAAADVGKGAPDVDPAAAEVDVADPQGGGLAPAQGGIDKAPARAGARGRPRRPAREPGVGEVDVVAALRP
jgi:hypothetical protein